MVNGLTACRPIIVAVGFFCFYFTLWLTRLCSLYLYTVENIHYTLKKINVSLQGARYYDVIAWIFRLYLYSAFVLTEVRSRDCQRNPRCVDTANVYVQLKYGMVSLFHRIQLVSPWCGFTHFTTCPLLILALSLSIVGDLNSVLKLFLRHRLINNWVPFFILN